MTPQPEWLGRHAMLIGVRGVFWSGGVFPVSPDRIDTMPAARYSEEFKERVVREVIDKGRTISSVASSYDLVPPDGR